MKPTMLSLVFLWYVVQVVSAEFPEELIEEHVHECLKELNLDKKIISSIFDDKLRVVNLDETGAKLLKCGVKKGNYFTPDGNLNKEVIVGRIAKWLKFMVKHDEKDSTALAEEFYQHCENVKGEDQFEVMKQWNKCLANKADTIQS
ncbi:uncharacterized protein LOC116167790 [Photinus pyralis]|uniref:Uncharacterized protein n=1 Tax=Photinus pyralis TaxID=7054 RepID=A0A1Y1NK99_PHOPY|nr:uncharacterized protein LOC116167790 [Photinus pyralis]